MFGEKPHHRCKFKKKINKRANGDSTTIEHGLKVTNMHISLTEQKPECILLTEHAINELVTALHRFSIEKNTETVQLEHMVHTIDL